MTEPVEPPDNGLPTLYIVPFAQWKSGDMSGALVAPEKVWWEHMSSNKDWLWRDLTTGFTDRREQLKAAYPDGYNVIFLEINEDLPEAIEHHFEKKETA